MKLGSISVPPAGVQVGALVQLKRAVSSAAPLQAASQMGKAHPCPGSQQGRGKVTAAKLQNTAGWERLFQQLNNWNRTTLNGEQKNVAQRLVLQAG